MMSETAQSIIHSALQEGLIQAAEEPIEATTFESARVTLNRMMNTLPFSRLGFKQVNYTNDRVTIDPQAADGVVTCLALRLCPQFDIVPNQLLYKAAKDAKNTILNMVVNIDPTPMPSTMSRGSGNNDYYGLYVDDFYPDQPVIPEDAYDFKVGETDTFTLDFNNYLLSGNTISSFTITANSYITVNSSSESGGVITYSVTGVSAGLGKVYITPTTSAGRINPEVENFNIKVPS